MEQSQSLAIERSIEVHSLALRGAAQRFDYLPFAASKQPEVLALLAAPGDAQQVQRANRYLEEINGQARSKALYVMDTTGKTLAASNWRQPKPNNFVGRSYGHRPYFIDARDRGKGLNYLIGVDTGEPGLFIATPITRGDEVIGVVAVKVSLESIDMAWKDLRDPVVLSDQRGVVFLGSQAPWMFNATRALRKDELDWIDQHDAYGNRKQFRVVPWAVERSEGRPWYRIDAEAGGRQREWLARDVTLPELGWTLTVMADHAPVTQARIVTWVVGGLGAGVLLLGALYWRLRERRYAEQRTARIDLEFQVHERTHELQAAHAFRKAMEDSLLVGMRARDLDGRIIYVNPALCDMVGRSADELKGRLPPYPYWHPDDLEQHQRINDDVLSGRAAPSGFESRLRHRDGHDVHTMVYTAPLIDGAGVHSGWMSSVVDITAQKHADERQRVQEERLQRAERLAILGEIGSMLAHELNQPLTAISSYASAAEAFVDQGNATLLLESLAGVKGQAQRAADIVRRVREMIRQRAEGTARTAGLSVVSINELVANALGALQADLQKAHVRVEQRLGENLPATTGDRVLLGQVVLNLVLNSLQAVHEVPESRRVIEIETTAGDGGVRLRVLDSGPGIPASAAGRLFEPFFTTKKDGLGLGLNICRTIVESHLGELSFENRAGGGAVFTIRLEASA